MKLEVREQIGHETRPALQKIDTLLLFSFSKEGRRVQLSAGNPRNNIYRADHCAQPFNGSKGVSYNPLASVRLENFTTGDVIV